MPKLQKTKKQPSSNNDMHRFGVLLEHVDSKVSLVAEQYGDVKKDTGDINKKLDAHTEMIGKLSINIEIVKEEIEFIKAGFKRKIDIEEFAALERRVSLLEKHR